jgi:hypothetical protein
MNVFTVREEFDIGLMIILFIFTAGIGVLIYLAVYYDKEPNHCVHCKTICRPKYIQQSSETISLVQPQPKSNKAISPEREIVSMIEKNVKFCSNCGVEIDDRGGKFCPFCGFKV